MNKNMQALKAIIVLSLCVISIFAYATYFRAPWFGQLLGLDSYFCAGSMLFAKHWYEANPFSQAFGLLWNPASVECPTLLSRDPYTSYPPGSILPVYLLSLLLHREPSLAIVASVNLFTQFSMALSLCLLALLLARRSGLSWEASLLFGLAPIPLLLLLPGPMFLFLVPYFADQAVLLPFALYVLLEVYRSDPPEGRNPGTWLEWAQTLVGLYGILTDWLFVFVLALVFVKRVLRGEFGGTVRSIARNGFLFSLPLAVALGLFALQIQALGGFAYIIRRFGVHSGFSSGGFLQVKVQNWFWGRHMPHGYGKVGLVLVGVAMAFVALGGLVLAVQWLTGRRRRDLGLLWWVSVLLLGPCLMYIVVFKNHSNNFLHFFSAAKFCLPIAFVPFVALPIFLLKALGIVWPRAAGNVAMVVAAAAMMTGAWAYAVVEFPAVKPRFDHLPVWADDGKDRALFIARNTGYNDVVFTPDGGLDINTCPLYLAWSMKRVYAASGIADMKKTIDNIPPEADYTVNLFVHTGTKAASREIAALFANATDEIRWSKYSLFKIPKAEFLKVAAQTK